MRTIVISPFLLRRTRVSSLVLGVSLIGFVCLLSGLDAPEYIRCRHIGICEFLEICGDVGAPQKSKVIMEAIGRFTHQSLSSKVCFGQPPFFLPYPGKIIHLTDTAKLQGDVVWKFDQMLDRFFHPVHKALYPPLLGEGSKVLAGKEQFSPSPGSGFSSQAFLIKTIAVIRC
ncbi:MAG: hypothetical protein AB1611_08540 [bacterium]